MLNHQKLVIALGAVLLSLIIIIASILSNEAWLSSKNIAIHIVIDNQTNQRIGPFTISDRQDLAPLHIDQIEPFSVVDFYYKESESWGENAIVLTESNDKNYAVIPYFENTQKGRVDIRVKCVTPNGLSGEKRSLTSWYFSFEWESWGASTCE